MRYYLGIDGGGTKTQFLLADETGHLVGSERLGGVDFTQVGEAGVRAVLEAGLAAVLQQSGMSQIRLAAVCAGIPCLGEYAAWDEECPRLFADIFTGIPTRCFNDSVVALFGSLALRPGDPSGGRNRFDCQRPGPSRRHRAQRRLERTFF